MNRSDPSRSWVAILAVPTEILYSEERAAALGRVIDEGEELGPAQRGHASIELTVDTYGKWLPLRNKAAVNRLDDESRSKTVAKTETGTSLTAEMPVNNGGPSRTRTLDPLIKSQ